MVKPNGGPNSLGDRWLDFRVDDHPNPIDELIRVANLTSRFKAVLKGNEKVRQCCHALPYFKSREQKAETQTSGVRIFQGALRCSP